MQIFIMTTIHICKLHLWCCILDFTISHGIHKSNKDDDQIDGSVSIFDSRIDLEYRGSIVFDRDKSGWRVFSKLLTLVTSQLETHLRHQGFPLFLFVKGRWWRESKFNARFLIFFQKQMRTGQFLKIHSLAWRLTWLILCCPFWEISLLLESRSFEIKGSSIVSQVFLFGDKVESPRVQILFVFASQNCLNALRAKQREKLFVSVFDNVSRERVYSFVYSALIFTSDRPETIKLWSGLGLRISLCDVTALIVQGIFAECWWKVLDLFEK